MFNRMLRLMTPALGVLLALAFQVATAAQAADDSPRQFGRDRSVDIERVRLELDLDLAARSVSGSAELAIRAMHDDTRRALLMGTDFKIRRVSVDGREVHVDYDGEKLIIPFDPPLLEDDRRVIRVEYSAHPQAGLYFTGDLRSLKSLQCYSQGEQEENHAWFPIHDDPAERITSETLISVAPPYEVVSNGPLLETLTRPDGRRTFHYKMDFPHVPYLLSIAAGDWATTKDTWEGVELTYHVPRAHAEEAARSLGRTPEVLAFLSAETGMKYPHSVYRQVAVSEFIYGGMENIAATTLTADTLHPARAHHDRPSESLVAHEAAHQWFGDVVTCSDWSDAWLNEGFATYYAALTMEHLFGPEKWAEELEGMRRGAIAADAAKRRPIVWNGYESADELFDGHAYEKGAMVLHALRRELGAALYRKAITAWLTEHSGRSANTHEFIATIERVTGRDVSKFADQWLFRAGEPDLLASWTFEDGRCALTVKQRQDRVADAGIVPLFDVPLDIEILREGSAEHHEVRITQENETFHFQMTERPRAVLVDPQGWLLRKLELERGTEEQRWVLAKAPFLMARMDAARELAEEAGQPETFDALVAATGSSQPWPLRKVAAEALGGAGTEGARDVLLRLLREEPDSRVRVVTARALAHYEEALVAQALVGALSGDASWEVQAAAASSLGAMDLPGYDRPLEAALSRRTHREVVFSAALAALRARRSPRAGELAMQWSKLGAPRRARMSAIAQLGEIVAREPDEKRRGEIRRHLESLLKDENVSVRGSLISALVATRDASVRPALEALRGGSPSPLTRAAARRGLASLDKALAQASNVADFQRQLDEERRAREKLADRIQSLESREPPIAEDKSPGAMP